jgi:hypothetical protein
MMFQTVAVIARNCDSESSSACSTDDDADDEGSDDRFQEAICRDKQSLHQCSSQLPQLRMPSAVIKRDSRPIIEVIGVESSVSNS